MNIAELQVILEKIKAQARAENFRLTRHALEEMVEEEISLCEVIEAITNSEVLENYPEHRRGACCLLNGKTAAGRPVHVLSTTARPELVIITVYEPKPPNWLTAAVRSRHP